LPLSASSAVAVASDTIASRGGSDEIAAFFDGFASVEDVWQRRNGGYHRLIRQVFAFQIPTDASILEVGCGSGDLLASLGVVDAVGVDLSPGMIESGRRRHPQLELSVGKAEELALGRDFDVIVVSDLTQYAEDLVAVFERIAAHSHPETRVIVQSYSRLWRPAIRVLELLRLKPSKPIRNWVSPDDVRNLFELTGFDVISEVRRILFPKHIPLLATLLNGFIANIWPINYLCLTHWVVARPTPRNGRERTVSVICPCRNERGNIAPLLERLPDIGSAMELLFVEGGSGDGTREEIERQIAAHPQKDIRLIGQPGRGKGDAVRAGFGAARHEVLMVLDGDLSVAPEDLPAFYRACVDGRADLVNGSRLVYDMERGAMRFMNMIGNRVFRLLVKAIIGQQVKDTLCGTKVLLRKRYEQIAAGRSYFGDFDPFGDFDLIFGAARLNLKVLDVPVRYQARTYGSTNISRWRHGVLLLKMVGFAFWKFRVTPVRIR
jgi:SAM-dependent methyltransferase